MQIAIDELKYRLDYLMSSEEHHREDADLHFRQYKESLALAQESGVKAEAVRQAIAKLQTV